MRKAWIVLASVFAASLAWLVANPAGPVTVLVGGQQLDLTTVAADGRIERANGGFYRVTLPMSRAAAESRLKAVGAEYVFDASADTIDRASSESIARHNRYLRAVAKLNGLSENDATATFKEAVEDEIDKRKGPNGYPDFEAMKRAVEQRELMPKAFIGYTDPNTNAPQAPWKHVGPFSTYGPFTYCYGTSTISGRKESIAVAKTDSATIWTVSRGGAYKSTDSGTTWKNMSAGWKFTNANAVAIDPTDANIVYVGTGDYADGGGFGSLPFGIMKTTDGGLSWNNYGDGTVFDTDEVITDVIIAPWNRNRLFCTTRHGNRLDPSAGNLYTSADAGVTWTDTGQATRSYTDLAASIGFTILSRTYYYVYAAADDGTVLRTSDGTTWTKTTTNPGSGYTHLACGKLSYQTIYAVTATGMVKRSTDRGDTWVDFNSGGFPLKDDGGSNWAQLSYNLFVGVTKVDADTERIWVGNLTCATRTTDTTTWTDVSRSYNTATRGHADHHSFANDPNDNNKVYIGTDGGLYRNYANDPTLLVGLNSPLGDFQLYSLDVHPSLPDFIMVGAQDNSVMASRGNLNAWTGLYKWDGGSVAFDKNNPKIQYTSSQKGGVFKYTADFAPSDTNTAITPTDTQRTGTAFIPPITTVGTGSELLMGTGRLLRYPGTGTTWTDCYDPPSTIDEIATIGNTVFFGCRDGSVYRSLDKGDTATKVDGVIPADPIGAIYMKSTTDVIVGTMGTTGGLYRSTNANAATPTWVDVSGSGVNGLPNTPVNCIAVDPSNSSRWYVGADAGLFMTDNAGATWANCNTQGFPNVCVTALKTMHGYLYAATAGRGAWRIKIGAALGFGISGTVFENGVGMKNVHLKVTANADIENRFSNSTSYPIPDNDPDGIASSLLNLTANHTMVSCKIFVHITHTFRGDIRIDLKAPDGTLYRLKNTSTSDSADDVVATYDVTGSLGGKSSLGLWQLQVRDLDAGAIGTLNTWSVIYTYAGAPTIAEVLTDQDGHYAFSALLPDNYFVTPYKGGKTFVPPFRSVTLVNTDVAGVNFNSLVPLSVTVPSALIGGSSGTGQLRMTTTPSSTVQVAMSDDSAYVTVPSTVAMSTIGPVDFPITTSEVATQVTATISASFGGVTKSDTVTLHPIPTLAGITAGPSPIYGGTAVTGTVSLSAAAPAPTTVNLSGYVPDLVPTTTSVTIPQGSVSAPFNATSSPVGAPVVRSLFATLGNQSKSADIALEPPPSISVWKINPATVNGGIQSVGTVTIARPVVNAPVRVYFTDNSTKLSMPAYKDIPVGQTTITIPVWTYPVTQTTLVTCYAHFAGPTGTKLFNVTLNPGPVISQWSISPQRVKGGVGATGTVVLSQAVTGSPLRVYFTDNSTRLATPPYVDIPVGQTTATIPIWTYSVTQNTDVTVYAYFAGPMGTKSFVETLTP